MLFDVLTQFRKMLTDLAGGPQEVRRHGRAHQRGTLAEEDWANELNPHPIGFKHLAERFLAELHSRFPSRI
jgi:hypothetical protein